MIITPRRLPCPPLTTFRCENCLRDDNRWNGTLHETQGECCLNYWTASCTEWVASLDQIMLLWRNLTKQTTCSSPAFAILTIVPNQKVFFSFISNVSSFELHSGGHIEFFPHTEGCIWRVQASCGWRNWVAMAISSTSGAQSVERPIRGR